MSHLPISSAEQTHTGIILKQCFLPFNVGILLSTESDSVHLHCGLSFCASVSQEVLKPLIHDYMLSSKVLEAVTEEKVGRELEGWVCAQPGPCWLCSGLPFGAAYSTAEQGKAPRKRAEGRWADGFGRLHPRWVTGCSVSSSCRLRSPWLSQCTGSRGP